MLRLGIRLIFATLLAAWASVSSHAADPYKVGLIAAATGYGSFIGDPEVKAARLYVKLLNQSGGINGRPVELIVYDSEGSPEKAVVAMKRLTTQDKVTAIVGPDFSATVRAVIPIVDEAKIVTYVMTPVIKPPPGSYMFAAYPIQEYAYEQQLAWFKKRGLNTLGVLASTDTTGQEGVKFLREIGQRLGVNIVVEQFNIQDVDVSPQLLNLQRRGSEGIMAAVSGKPFAVVAKSMKQLNMKLPLLASTGSVTNTLGELLKGIEPELLLLPTLRIFVADQLPKDDPQLPAITKLREVYKKEYGAEPDLYAAVGWDSTEIVIKAIAATGGNPAQMRDYIENLRNYVGTVCIVNMKPEDHHGCAPDGYVLVQFKDGKFVLER
ncbi:MAG: ABC transporter substrate-binding protein [Anaerolineales bacterium]|nr:ABC transporter substrate-binding protein [Alphaproteobacteria bacterium]MCW5886786.1 ABC transporter substrate-binding protein [Anaerolineales bacterium]